ncbi:PIN/TRAM domain-containing protein [Vagococcus zengguangii]|uniref:PIN/TRAM domain-containing protein n=1 Tax=Vagococcus zengguangii TaxID=2571750 RepID=A0A4D7CSW6_9ENTE|nr:PIN/TRAM domain-containing protein [Vagococcus zengguangii]QCI87259.1 PIN/TRAM domain-containing protein [Vagococcus zengguangii]TLG80763.1 PIN/TRAM domain-containing protein [Vagococcus zengguangii]
MKKVYHIILTILGGGIGVSILPELWEALNLDGNGYLNNFIVNILIGAGLFYLLSLLTANKFISQYKKLEETISKKSSQYLLFGSIGAIIGLLLGVLMSVPFYNMEIKLIRDIIPALILLTLGFLGFRIGTTKMDDWRKLFIPKNRKNAEDVLERKVDETFRKYKILDTSVIIDGRIYDIAKTGFIEGTLLIPNFVLYELQYIADSGDSLKRVRGRRGLDILNALQKEESVDVEMYDGDFDDITEVDSKLIRLAKLLDGVLVTNDYNLNKVSEFQNVPVLNINALANAVKPVVIPGENMRVKVVKAGTERQQGVAYLDDGTMIVVEDGQHFMNKEIEVVVTSALQTAAGRMIFAKPVHAQRSIMEENK